MPRRGAVVLRIIESESASNGPLSPSSGTIHAIGPVEDVHTPPVDTRGELYAESSPMYGQIVGELSTLAKSHIRPYIWSTGTVGQREPMLPWELSKSMENKAAP